MLRLSLLIALFATPIHLLLAQGKIYWQQQANYTISVALNDTSHSLNGQLKLHYTNNSPDTLPFIWMHLWPNAYKNDRTAFAEQDLLAGNTEFYFSKTGQRGYINLINFSVNGEPAKTEDHPSYIDVVKLLLPTPLLPGQSTIIETPFHVQLPNIFSRGGHLDQFYAVTQWFPKAAVYDQRGWHPMPYLYSAEYYADFGNYNVSITVPANYVVAATGMLQSEEEKNWLKSRTKNPFPPKEKQAPKQLFTTETKNKKPSIASDTKTKTLVYEANNVIDFAWFADKSFMVKYDTMQLGNDLKEVWNFMHPEDEKNWSQSIPFTKRAVRFYSAQLGNYPYPQVSVVSNPLPNPDGMEYPMITMLNFKPHIAQELDLLIAHEVGHNWLQAVLASSERNYAWMDEGINTYYERKYKQTFYPPSNNAKPKGLNALLAGDPLQLSLQKKISLHEDMPLNTGSDQMKPDVYYDVVYTKAADWMEMLERRIGKENMEAAMHQYFEQWQFKHPWPDDFRKTMESAAGKSLQEEFNALNTKGAADNTPVVRKTKLTPLFNYTNTATTRYIGIAPAIGFNNYDKTEIGLLVHNYNIPANKFQFAIAPMFATGSKQLVGYANANYAWYPKKNWHKVELFAGLARFNQDKGDGPDGEALPVSFLKFTPGVAFTFKPKSALSTLTRRLDFRTFIISEQQLSIESPPPPGDTVFYSVRNGATTTVIPQLTMTWQNDRALYPWKIEAGLQQVKQIVRTTVNANYFLNYRKNNKGVYVRLFAGTIFYTADKTTSVRNDNSRYHFTMYAPNGAQDYTYSSPFAERNQATTFFGRQIHMRDGGFKYRSDYSSVVPGLEPSGIDYFDSWLVSLNTKFDIPDQLNPLGFLPFDVNWKIFADLGTSASPWKEGSEQSRFLYSIGIHLPIFKVLNFYYPIFHSDAFNEPNSVNDPYREGGPLWWQKRLTFSIDTDQLKNMLGRFPL